MRDNRKIGDLAKFLLLVFALGLLWYLGRFLHIDSGFIQAYVARFPAGLSALVYVLLYVVVTFFIFFSKDIFWIAGALLFGAYASTALIYISEVINAFILFYIARYLGRNFVEGYLKQRSAGWDLRFAKISFFWLFMLRAVPLVPYRFLDLGFGLTKISFRKYLLAVLLATPVKTFWVQYILAEMGLRIFTQPQELVSYLLANRSLFMFSLIYALLLIPLSLKLKKSL